MQPRAGSNDDLENDLAAGAAAFGTCQRFPDSARRRTVATCAFNWPASTMSRMSENCPASDLQDTRAARTPCCCAWSFGNSTAVTEHPPFPEGVKRPCESVPADRVEDEIHVASHSFERLPCVVDEFVHAEAANVGLVAPRGHGTDGVPRAVSRSERHLTDSAGFKRGTPPTRPPPRAGIAASP